MNRILVFSVLVAAGGLAFAKLPPPDDATKAKVPETTARAAWQAKVDGYQLCKAQDKVAAQYMKTAGKTAPAAPAPAAQPPVAAASGTPVAAAQLPPCADPGPFAYNPPEQKPLEAAGAHSPPGTAASPPSGKTPSAEIAPAKK